MTPADRDALLLAMDAKLDQLLAISGAEVVTPWFDAKVPDLTKVTPHTGETLASASSRTGKQQIYYSNIDSRRSYVTWDYDPVAVEMPDPHGVFVNPDTVEILAPTPTGRRKCVTPPASIPEWLFTFSEVHQPNPEEVRRLINWAKDHSSTVLTKTAREFALGWPDYHQTYPKRKPISSFQGWVRVAEKNHNNSPSIQIPTNSRHGPDAYEQQEARRRAEAATEGYENVE